MMLLIIGIVAGCNQTTASQQQAANTTVKPQASPAATAAAQPVQQEAKRISLDEAKAAFDAGKAFFIDTRDADAYNSEHIKGAVNITADQVQNRYKQLPTDKQIIAYCS
jgi:3-mercaptopyruvate sulfurtransferase SseA